MLTNVSAYLKRAIKYLLFATAFVPLLFSGKFFFPFITQKLFFVRGVILVAFALALLLLVWLFFFERNRLKVICVNLFSRLRKSAAIKPLLIFGGIFILSQIASTIFAEFPGKAFWGTLERGQGLFNLFHFVVFFALLAIFFSKDDFKRYFQFSVVVGLIVYFYAILQAFGFTQFPFAFQPFSRPGSFLGNGAFLAAYSFFVMIASIITIWFSKNQLSASISSNQHKSASINKLWFNLSVITIAVTPIIIFITKTRGALVGLAVGVIAILIYFSIYGGSISLRKLNFPKSVVRKLSAAILVLFVVFGATLFLTREASLWQNIPGLDRLTRVSFLEDPSVRVRLLGWELAAKAFLEKPIFGWGPEHYLVAFERRYDTEFSTYGDTWLDRAHNGILDVAATQGIVGLVGYVGFLVGAFWFFFRRGPNFYLRFFVGVAFLGFTAQNLFLLEEFHVFAPFFVLMAAIIAGVFTTTNNQKLITDNQPLDFARGKQLTVDSSTSLWASDQKPLIANRYTLYPAVVGSILILVATSFVLYKTVLVPVVQAYYAHKTETAESKEEFFKFFSKATEPYNFAQHSIRAHLFDFFYANRPTVFTDFKLADIGNEFVFKTREVLERDGPYDVRLYIRLSQAYQEMAKQDPPIEDPLLRYRAGEEILREALLISPNRPELAYGLGFALAGQGRHDEAIEVMEKSVASNPNSSQISRLQYYYGLILFAGGKRDRALQVFEIMRAADPELTRLFPNDVKGLFSIYESLGEYARIIDIVTESARGKIQARIDLQYYEIALPYYLYQENGEGMIVIAEFIAEKFPERKDDMETIIELVKNNEWDILRSL